MPFSPHRRYVFASDIRRRKEARRRRFRTVFIIAVFLVLLTAMWNYASTTHARLDSRSVTVANLPEALEQYSILHISDLHGQVLGRGQSGLSSALTAKANSIIVMTGDMIGRDGSVQPLLDLIRQLPASTPKLLLLGDEDPDYLDAAPHANTSPYADWAQQVIAAGVTIVDEPILFTRGTRQNARIWFVPEYLYTLDLDGMERSYARQAARYGDDRQLGPAEAAQKRVAEYQVARMQRIRAAIQDIREGDIQICLTHTPLSQADMTTMLQWADRGKAFSARNIASTLAGHYAVG